MHAVFLFVFIALSMGGCAGSCIDIEQGTLRGRAGLDRKGNVFYSFLSIPYAKSPVGDLRFRPPQAPEKWNGILNATLDLPACAQLYLGKELGQEDCLYLNVHTPKIPENDKVPLKPVFFYIHGGAFIEGSGNNKYFGGEFLMPADVVLITINYRLGLFGFLSSKDESLGISGNAGLKDQNMALRWVQKNIKKFGGDPNNVMIVGESAGGASVHYHMLSPASKGLFHKVVAMSGFAVSPWATGIPGTLEILGRGNLETGSNDSKEILKEFRKLSTIDILRFQKMDGFAIAVHEENQCSPVIEKVVPGAFITQSPLQSIKEGNFNQVPFMIGYTDKDGLAIDIMNRLYNHKPLIIDDFSTMIPRDLNKQGGNLMDIQDKIKKFYFGDEEMREDTFDKNIDLFTGVWFFTGITRILNFQSRTLKKPLYLYRFTADTKLNYFKQLTPETANYKGASHIDDLGYLFKTEKTPEIVTGSQEDLAIDNVVNLFTNFAKFGKPSDDWLPVTPKKINYMEIGISSQPGVDPDNKAFKFWNDLYDEYAL